MNTKIITMYLPQFHNVKENDEWWGPGFTEWTAVKNATSLYKGHIQPRVPYDENYYNLLDKKTMLWQANLMRKYGVYGQCFYHYYFKDGRKILEKPAECLLEWTDIDMPFCFSWANESWVTSWSNIRGGNAWAERFETESNKNINNGVLLEQKYGKEGDWISHFEYLLPFFKDERYIKKDNRPLFLIYKPDDINCLHDMIDCWNDLAIKNGFNGIYYIGTNSNPDNMLDGLLYAEPQTTFSGKYVHNNVKNNSPYIIEGHEICKYIATKRVESNCFLCGTPGFDNSPRKGKYSTIIRNLTPEEFYKQMQSIISVSNMSDRDYVFINAWNEWGEGMYLEPDNENGYQYLEALNRAIIDSAKDPIYRPDNGRKNMDGHDYLSQRYRNYWMLFDKWMSLLENNTSIEEFFTKNNYKKIAIYGHGMFGMHLKKQLERSQIEVLCFIDIKNDIKKDKIPVLGINDDLPVVDVVVVCVLYDKEPIKECLAAKGIGTIIFIGQVVDELLEMI